MNSRIVDLIKEPIVTGFIVILSLLFLSNFLPWISKWIVAKIFKKLTKFDLKIDNIGIFWASNLKFTLSKNDSVLLTAYCSKISIKFNLLDKESKTYFTILCDKIMFDTNLVDFPDILKVLKRKTRSKDHLKPITTDSSKSLNWLIKASKFYNFQIVKIVFRIKLSSIERSPVIYLFGDEVKLLITPETNRLNSQLSVGTAAGKIICPSLSNDQWNLLANFRSQINFDFIFIKKQKLFLNKFLVTIGSTKLLLLEEIFHELAQVTKYDYVEQPSVVGQTQKSEDKKLLYPCLEYLPKECGVDFEKFEVSLIRIDVSRNLNLTWNKCYASILQPSDAIEDMRFFECSDIEIDIDKNRLMGGDIPAEEVLKFKTGCYGLNISSCVSTTTSWRRLELTGQVDIGSLAVKCRIDNPCLIINIDELAFWNELFIDANALFNQLFPKSPNKRSSNQSLKSDITLPGIHYTLKLEVNCSHRGQTINSDSLALIQIINNSFEAGLELGLKTLVASYEADTSHNDHDKLIQSIDLYSDINTAYCKLINDPRSNRIDYVDYFHRWDTSVFMGNVFVWVHKNRAGCLMNQVQLEVSEHLAAVTLKIFDTIRSVRHSDKNVEEPVVLTPNQSGSLMTAFIKIDLEMKLEHVDLFAVSSQKAFIRQRINVIQLNKTSQEIIEIDLKFSEMVYDIVDTNNDMYATTIDYSDANNRSPYFKDIFNIQHIKMEYYLDRKALSIHCLDKIDSFWDTSIHLCLLEAFVNLNKIRKNVKLIQKVKKVKPAEPMVKSYIYLELGSGIQTKFCLSNEHDVTLRMDSTNIHVSQQRSKVVSHNIALDCDGRQIITFQNFSWKELVPTNKYRQDKEKLKLMDATNRAWEIQADKFFISFPYKYRFNECYHDIISIKKFIKKVHSSNNLKQKINDFESDNNKRQTIPPDYIICLKEFQLELKDDPFECQLLDNYLVLRDENEEHEKRILRMKSQLKKLVKSGGNYTDLEYQRCLYQLDLQKQSQYIARISSVRSTESTEPANNLFRWTITDLSLMSLSDSDFYGSENAIRHMRNIDADSPFPEGIKFSTLWCRMISLNADSWCFQMREYLKSLWTMKDLYVWGRLVVAEQSATEKAKRTLKVNVDDPWSDVTIERSMPTVKFFHDFSADMKENSICYGPNWESCLQWINICWELVNRSSRDPSPSLPWWDKSRLRLHGRLWFLADVMDWYYPVSLDPYNNTEFFHWQWNAVRVSWENMKWILEGDLGIFCRSASKYDGDCQLIDWPNLQLKINIFWLCNGDPNDHFSVEPTDPAFVTSSDHDTYYFFRSRNLDLEIEFNCNESPSEEFPRCIFYTNILKFFEKFKNCTRRVSRPIRRGRYFNYFRRKKPVLGRHCRFIYVRLNTPQLNLIYWLSLAKKSGVHMITGPISLSTQFQLKLINISDNLHHRPQTNWSIVQMKSQIRKSLKVWLIEKAEEALDDRCPSEKYRLFTEHDNKDLFHEKCRYEFIILSHLKYDRLSSDNAVTDYSVPLNCSMLNDASETAVNDQDLSPVHNLKIVDLKVRWNQTNRNLVYSMLDIYRHKTLLRKNLSAQALKSIQLQIQPNSYLDAKPNSLSARSDQENIYKKAHNITDERSTSEINLSDEKLGSQKPSDRQRASSASYSNKNPSINQSGSHLMENDNPMLRQLLQEVDTAKLYAFCEEESKDVNVVDKLTGVELCKSNVKISRKWHLELINSQVMLKTNQSSVYAIVSAAQTRLDSYEHMPIWKDSQLLTKSSIVGKLECMQYYATVGKVNPSFGQQWLNTCDVEDQVDNEDLLSGTPEVVGCGKAVGGVVSTCVGHIDPITSGISNSPEHDGSSKHSIKSESVGRIQLQRMISKCSCMAYYISYDRADPIVLPQHLIPPIPLEEDEISHSSEGATTLTLLHSNLNVVTNSLQYHMIVEIINDLILYVEPRKKARDDRNKVEFSLLSEDQLKLTILKNQEYLRSLVHCQMRYERELWKVVVEEQISRIKYLEDLIKRLKTDIEEKNSALSQCIEIYQQMRIQSQRRDLHMKSSFSKSSLTTNQQTPGSSNISNANSLQDNNKKVLKSHSTSSDIMIRSTSDIIRRNEVCFEHATWRMTENDGQIGLCDVELRGFIYTKVTREDNSGAHSFELNTVKVESLVNNCFFKEVLMMDASSEMNIGGPVLRINLIERYPVGGIKVNEAMEICIAPLVLQISKLFYMTMMPYFFPGKADEMEIEKGSDNMSFVKSESMELKRSIDNASGCEGVLLGQNIEMTDIDQFLGETHSTVDGSSLPTFGTKLRKLASFGNLKSRKKEKFVSNSDDNLSPCSTSEPTGILNTSLNTEALSTDLSRNVAVSDYPNFEEINDNLESSKPRFDFYPSSHLKVEDVISNQRIDKTNRTPDMMISDYYTTVDSLQSNSADRQSKKIAADHSKMTIPSNGKSESSLNAQSKDPLQLMAERAKQNYMFLYVKIHGFPIRLSYRGEKQKTFAINNFALNITPIEYHNRLWTWLDLNMEVKKSIRKQLVLEALKQKFKIKKNPFSLVNNSSFNQKMKEEDREKKKMEMLLGVHALPVDELFLMSRLITNNDISVFAEGGQ